MSGSAMRRAVAPHVVLRLAMVCSLFACAVLLVDYISAGGAGFCGAGSGCMVVRRSPWSHVGNAPLPALGLVAQLSLYVVAIAAREKAAQLVVAIAALIGGALAVGLIGLQAFVIQAFCKWCVVVDLATIVTAFAAVATYQASHEEPGIAVLERLRRPMLVIPWLGGAALACALPFVWSELPDVPPLPAKVAAYAVPGKLTIVSFTDFECPFCRRLSPVLHEVIDANPGKVELVRLMVPLAAHPGALPAALAYECSPKAKQDAMAAALYGAPTSKLKTDGVKAIALGLHIDEPTFVSCVGDIEASKRVDVGRNLFEELDLDGLPYTYVGNRAFLGANPDALRKLVRQGLGSPLPGLPVWAMLVVAAGIAAALAAITVRMVAKD